MRVPLASFRETCAVLDRSLLGQMPAICLMGHEPERTWFLQDLGFWCILEIVDGGSDIFGGWSWMVILVRDRVTRDVVGAVGRVLFSVGWV